MIIKINASFTIFVEITLISVEWINRMTNNDREKRNIQSVNTGLRLK